MVLLSGFLLTRKNDNRLPHVLFSAFLLTTALDMIGFFVPLTGHLFFDSIKAASVLLQMPLFFLYTLAACYYNFQLSGKHLLHAIPFAVLLAVFLIYGFSEVTFSAFDRVTTVQYYGYILAVLYTLITFRKVSQEHYAANHQQTYRWLLQTTLLFLTGNLLSVLRNTIAPSYSTETFLVLNLAVSIFALVIISWFVLKAMSQPHLFQGVDKDLTVPDTAPQEAPIPAALDQIAQHMASEQSYLDPELTLQKLALQVNLPEKEVSQLINQHAGKHFFDYINDFRIADAKVLLTQKKDLTVLEILYEVGFNSKSSFYTAFKKVTGTTPTVYRKSGS